MNLVKEYILLKKRVDKLYCNISDNNESTVELDPTVPLWVKNITEDDIERWNEILDISEKANKTYVDQRDNYIIGLIQQSGDKYWVHQQTLPSSRWEIVHPLNKRPSVSFENSAGQKIMAPYEYVTDNLIIAEFNGAVAGKAFLN